MFSRQEKLLLFAIAAIQFNHIVDFMIMMPLGPQLIRTFQISPQQFSFLVASYTFFAGVSGFIGSFFMDKWNRKTLLLFFFSGFTLGTLACSTSENYLSLLISRSIAGAFGGVLNSVTLAIISDNFSYEKRGTALGWTSTSFSLASIFGVPFSIFLATHYHWQSPFLFLGLMCLILFFLILKVIPNSKPPAKPSGNFFEPLKIVFNSSNLLFGLLFMMLVFLSQFSVIPFLSPSLVANTGLTEKQLPLVYLVGGILSIIAAPEIGKLTDKIGKHKVFTLGAVVSIIPFFFITHLGVTPIYITLSLTGLFFVSMGFRMIPAMALISGAPHPANRGSYMGLVSSVQSLSSAIAASLAGTIITKDAETNRLLNYGAVGYIAILFTILAILVIPKVNAYIPTKSPNTL
ncbi:MAG: MFS transporter [Bdellovibrionaceae bacterium]|nr:MFS transporter [Pseudobdellovibrionaceae bacterium]NUM57846.1 MFS transporter [Pseudobdellovibrionaceae bacterium]